MSALAIIGLTIGGVAAVFFLWFHYGYSHFWPGT